MGRARERASAVPRRRLARRAARRAAVAPDVHRARIGADACPVQRSASLVGSATVRTIPWMRDPAGIQSLLLMRLSAIGDVANTLPAVSAVRRAFPRARIGF